jgi:hypothetical protein
MISTVAVPRYCRVAACVVAGDARVDRRTAVARGGEAALDVERASGGRAGEDQLQPLFVAAVVSVRE